jgi:hypothetical protein
MESIEFFGGFVASLVVGLAIVGVAALAATITITLLVRRDRCAHQSVRFYGVGRADGTIGVLVDLGRSKLWYHVGSGTKVWRCQDCGTLLWGLAVEEKMGAENA